ncbi:unnamed protein product, partial [Effrenium voratum]
MSSLAMSARAVPASSSRGRSRLRRAPRAPRRFLEHVCAPLAACELRRFLRSCARAPPRALRLSRRREATLRRLAQEGLQVTPSPFSADGFFLKVKEELQQAPALGQSLSHYSGQVYGQEASSTLPAEALRALGARGRLLDLCAAPGSKASQLASQLEPELLVANEPRKHRAALLRANLLRAGIVEALVLTLDGREVGSLAPGAFDAVLVDAPCSGEGNIRKDQGAWDRWVQEDHSSQSRRALQRELLLSGWEALRPGGLLVYSTCTLNQEENEVQCRWLRARGAEVLPLRLGLPCIETEEGFLRVWPHHVDVEGFFVAGFRKGCRPVPPTLKSLHGGGQSIGNASFSEAGKAGSQPSLEADPRRLPPSREAELREQIAKELCFTLPEGPMLEEAGEVFWVPEALCCPSLAALRPRLAPLTAAPDGPELQLVAGGDFPAERWLQLHGRVGGGLGSATLALGRAKDARSAAAAFQDLLQQRLAPDVASYNALMNAYAKESLNGRAQQVLEDMANVSVTPGVISFTILIEAHARAGDLTAAQEAFRSMSSLQLQPNEVTHTALLRAFLQAKQLPEAERLADRRLNLAEAQDGSDMAVGQN